MEVRYAAIESSGRRIEGIAVRYGDVADIPGIGAETFAPGAFGDVAGADVVLNAMHQRTVPLARTGGGGMRLIDDDSALRFQADLPSTAAADDTLELIRAGVLRGASVEFNATSEAYDGGVRRIQAAQLGNVAIVDRPAYPDSSIALRWELRRRGGGISGSIRYNRNRVTNDRNRRRKRRYARGAFNPVLDRWNKLQNEVGALISSEIDSGLRERIAQAPDVLLTVGRSSETSIASMKQGTLRFDDRDDGLHFQADDVTGTAAGREVLERIGSGQLRMGADPIYRLAPSYVAKLATKIHIEEEGRVEVEEVLSAMLRAVAIVNRHELGEGGDVAVRYRRWFPWL